MIASGFRFLIKTASQGAMEPTKGKFEVDKFDGHGDFAIWKHKMLCALEILGLDSVLEEEPTASEEDAEKSESEKDVKPDPTKAAKDKRVRSLIQMSLSDQIIRKVMKETTALGIWRALERDYQTKSLPNRIYLKQRFASYKMDEHKSIEENLDIFLKLVNDLESLSIKISDEDQAIQILTGLPPKFEPLVHTLKYGSGKDTLTVNDVVTTAYAKETELRERGLLGKSKADAEGLYVSERGRGDRKGSYSRNRSKSRGRNSSRQKDSKSRGACFICGKEGHWKRECPDKGKNKGTSSVNVASSKNQPLILTASIQDTRDEWVMDSGASLHITPNRDLLFDFKDCSGGKVLMGNNTFSEINGVGKIRIKRHDGSVVILTDVKYMPTMGRNLISYGCLERAGCNYVGGDYSVKFYKDGAEVLSGKYTDGLYYLEGTVLRGEGCSAIVSSQIDSTKKWHSRFGHISQKGLERLVKEGYLEESDIKKLEFCESCVFGKAHKQSFKKGKHTSKEVLEYVHSDLWGAPSVVPSLAGKQYFITFIDDYSRKVWIYFLKTKDEAFETFEEWKKEVETQTGRKVKCLRTDNGLEYCNNRFDGFYKKFGIKRHRTCSYTPQQNGVSERMNRTIMERVRCMLSESGMEEKFWAEAASTAVYLINRSPSSATDYKLPEELWSGKRPGIKHLRRFGAAAYVHTRQAKTSPRAVKGYFVGYPDGVKGFRVWLPEEKKCVISRNVIFHEEEVIKHSQGVTKPVEAGETNGLNKGKGVLKQDKKRVSFSPDLIKGPSPCKNDSEASTSGSEPSESSVSGGVVSDSQGEAVAQEEEVTVDSTEAEEQDLDNYILARDRKRRETKMPSKYDDFDVVAYALSAAQDIEVDEPRSYQEAMRSKDRVFWTAASDDEMVSLNKNETWVLVQRPDKKRVIGCKWVYKKKPGIPGIEPPRHKGRLVAKGYSQVEGVDYNEVFAPVVKHISIRNILSLVVNEDLHLEQLDVKTAFLNGTLEEEIFMEQPEGYEVKGKEDMVCLLKKSLYGLKQSPRQWNKRFDGFMKDQGFRQSPYDQCVYISGEELTGRIYLLIYVDDMLLVSKSMDLIQNLKDKLSREFEMKDLGAATRILGMDILRNREEGTLKLSQGKYLEKVLSTFNMSDCKPVTTPLGAQFKLKSLDEKEEVTEPQFMVDIPYASAVGSLMYAMVGSRPDIAHAVGVVSRFMGNPGRKHWEAVKWILRYIRGTTDFGLWFKKGEGFRVEGYSDADYATDLDRRRSVTGYLFQVGNNTVSWRSGLQPIVALSTTESEYMALNEAAKEALWLKGFCEDLNYDQGAVKVNCDSQSAIFLAKNGGYHERTKHIHTKFNFIRDVIANGSVSVVKVHTTVNLADILTKSVPGKTLEKALVSIKVSD